ncbi:MAG TPA: AtpZ/AtpI family protein [candidate division Zixibacteria bacterium]|nr:AtpZ/AtpI family protein [candidate division Zixibacteria bacterium]
MKDKEQRPGKHSAEEMGRRAKEIGSLGLIPIILAVGPIIGALIGQWLDKRFATAPWLTIVFVIFGFVAAVREMLRLIKSAETREKQEQQDKQTTESGQDEPREPHDRDKHT